ncbi:MAG: protein-disulfide reductase DsbD domain-containing protein [Chitinophagaceae bacterium]
MNKFFLALLGLGLSATTMAQIKNPVKWAYTAKKIADKTYEVHITATIDPGWHVYTLDHKADVGIATSVNFTKNPLATADGKLRAKGKPVTMKDPSTGDLVKFYEGTVDIIQVFKLKANVKTNIAGELEFMTCDDHQCLPPTTKQFTVSLQ